MKKVILIAAAMAAASGCATVVRGTKETAKFESFPAGATVTASRITENDDNPVSCITPCKLELSRKRDFNITYELDGYKPAKAKLSSLVTAGGGAGFLGNALAGGPIGAVVDGGTGATHDLRPIPMIARLQPLGSDEASKVFDKEDNPAPQWEEPEMQTAAAEDSSERDETQDSASTD